ncbi:MAG: peptidylprolyl isomerase [Lentisphaerae bacterium]|nr:peptidylprolyl isomerase [Lentisphaerota bacterium]
MTLSVNAEPIPEGAIQYELDRLVRFYSEHMSASEIRSQMDALKRRAKEQAIGGRLLIVEAARLDIQVPEEDIRDRLDRMVENAGGRPAFDEILQRQGMTEEAVRQSIEQGRRVDLLVDRITEGTPDPTEDEIKAHFEEHGEEYSRPERAQAQHVLLCPASDSEADRNTAKARLLEIRQKVEEGTDFAEQAAAHSDCPSGKTAGGSLGWLVPGTTVPEFDEAVFSLEVGELSDIVETELGFHLLRKTAQEESGPAEYDEVHEKIRDFLRHARRGEAISACVRELRDKAVIEETRDSPGSEL